METTTTKTGMKLSDAQVQLLRRVARWNEVPISFQNAHTFYALQRMGLITRGRYARLALPLSAEIEQLIADVEPIAVVKLWEVFNRYTLPDEGIPIIFRYIVVGKTAEEAIENLKEERSPLGEFQARPWEGKTVSLGYVNAAQAKRLGITWEVRS